MPRRERSDRDEVRQQLVERVSASACSAPTDGTKSISTSPPREGRPVAARHRSRCRPRRTPRWRAACPSRAPTSTTRSTPSRFSSAAENRAFSCVLRERSSTQRTGTPYSSRSASLHQRRLARAAARRRCRRSPAPATGQLRDLRAVADPLERRAGPACRRRTRGASRRVPPPRITIAFASAASRDVERRAIEARVSPQATIGRQRAAAAATSGAESRRERPRQRAAAAAPGQRRAQQSTRRMIEQAARVGRAATERLEPTPLRTDEDAQSIARAQRSSSRAARARARPGSRRRCPKVAKATIPSSPAPAPC